jgi:hypothetical protein
VEPGGLLQRELSRLGGQTADILHKDVISYSQSLFCWITSLERSDNGRNTYMVVVEQEHGQKPERQGSENPLDLQIPEMKEPASVLGRIKGARDRQKPNMSRLQVSWKMRETHPEESAQLHLLAHLASNRKVGCDDR